jgi:hypothetical protein
MSGLWRKTIPRSGAKTSGRNRPLYVMPGSVALTGLTALLALAGCFQLNIGSCRLLCKTDPDCPNDLRCLVDPTTGQGLCASPATLTCTDAGVGGRDAGVDHRMDASGADAETGSSGPPSMLCHNETCFPLPEDVRSNLVLLLWPSNLPPVGSPVSIWADQSGQGNDAHALSTTALAHVIPDGVQLASATSGSGFVVANSPSLDFGAGDFAVIVVAGLSSSTTPVTLFRKTDGLRTNSRQIAIDWALSSAAVGQPQGTVDDTVISANVNISQPSVEAYGLYRSTDHVELRINGSTVGSADLPTPGLTTSNAENVYVGVGSMFGTPADSIEAMIAIRGTIGSTELDQLGDFLRTVFTTSSP